jgi:uncharacterized protein YjiS (DUF1127 family)
MTTAQLTTSLKSMTPGRFSLLWRMGATIYLMSMRMTSAVAKQRSRHQLASLDDSQLRDIGISREDALRESKKPFWG